MRDASSLVLAARLQGEGVEVSAYDPIAADRARELLPEVEIADSAAAALEGADAAILVTEWPEFAELDWEELAGRMANPLIVDGRNFLDPRAAARRGLYLRGDRSRTADHRGARLELMRALVLVGGEGTRLRPLTLTQPKPALALVDRPFIRYLVDWVGRHGIDEVIMACGFQAEGLREALGDAVPGGPSIVYIEEDEPLGTAGPIRLAAEPGCSTSGSWSSTATCSPTST